MELKRGDIVLIPFPFTDLSGKKVRPALIVSGDPQQEDLLALFISSVIPFKRSEYDYVFSANHPEFHQTGLKVSSVFKSRKIATLNRLQILRRLGSLPSSIRPEIDRRLRLSFGLTTHP